MVIKSKRFSILAIVFAIALSSLTSVYAEDEYIQGFKKVNTYTDGQFSDVSSEWFSTSVQQAYETGLMYGNSQNTFNPAGNIDNAAVIAIAARLHSIYKSDNASFDSGSSIWYEPYINYAINNGICDSNINPSDISTRSFFVGILGNAVDDSILKQKNTINNGALSDVSGWYSNAVYAFYRAGILCGNDEYGTFAPDSPITRAEVAAIVMRLVKPSERVETVLTARPTSTYSIMDDDGSLEAYKQRAILANLKVLLNGEQKDERWQNDVWSVEHAEIPGDEIYVDKWDIELTYEAGAYYVNVPKRYFGEDSDAYKLVGWWSLYTGFRSFLTGYTGSMPDGQFSDLYLSRPAVAAYTEKYTYSDFTKDAQYLIDSAPRTSVIDEKVVKDYINKAYGTSEQNNLYIGYLTDWKDDWYITYNKNNIYNPSPRENDNSNQSEFIFTPESAELKQWCKNNSGKYVVALIAEDLKMPVFLAEILDYSPTNENATVKSWDYSNNKLTIQWNNIQIDFAKPFTVFEQSKINYMRDLTGLLPVEYSTYEGAYYQDDVYDGKFFSMVVDENNIRIIHSGKTILFTLYSDKAIIDGFEEEYNVLGDFVGYKETGKGKTVEITAPKRLYDAKSRQFVYYLPPKFIADTLFNSKSTANTSSTRTEDEYTKDEEKSTKELKTLTNNGYAKVCKSSGSEWASYLEGYNDVKFRFGKREGIEGYDYEISRSYNGPHIGFNLNSKKACVQVWYNGTEYGEQVITIPEPKEFDGDIYLPVDEILDALEEDGQGFERKRI